MKYIQQGLMIQLNKMTMKKFLKILFINVIFVLSTTTSLVAQNTCNVTKNPKVDNPEPASVYGTTKIEVVSVYSDQTVVALRYNTGKHSGGWVQLASSTYMLVNGEKYPIQAWGHDTDNDIVNLDFDYQYTVEPNTSYRFLMSFPPVPVGVENISIVESIPSGDGFYWYGIHINNSTPLVARTNNSTYSGVGSELVGTTFKVTKAIYNGTDRGSEPLTNDHAMHFYINNDGEFSFSNHWRKQDSQSYGVIYGMKKTDKQAIENSYASTEYKFTWNYFNTYDDKTGSALITFTIIYLDDVIKFTSKMLVLDTNDIYEYKGFLED